MPAREAEGRPRANLKRMVKMAAVSINGQSGGPPGVIAPDKVTPALKFNRCKGLRKMTASRTLRKSGQFADTFLQQKCRDLARRGSSRSSRPTCSGSPEVWRPAPPDLRPVVYACGKQPPPERTMQDSLTRPRYKPSGKFDAVSFVVHVAVLLGAALLFGSGMAWAMAHDLQLPILLCLFPALVLGGLAQYAVRGSRCRQPFLAAAAGALAGLTALLASYHLDGCGRWG